MKQEIKLIYIGILKFGFKNSGKVSIVGLIDYMIRNRLELETRPEMTVNRSYVSNSDDWFWEIEWWNETAKDNRCLVVYFDEIGCHYNRFYDRSMIKYWNDDSGDIKEYGQFLAQFRWLAGD